MGLFERYLTLWVGGAIALGIALGSLLPEAFRLVASLEVAQVNLVVAVLIWVMIYPMMVQVDFGSLRHVGDRPDVSGRDPGDHVAQVVGIVQAFRGARRVDERRRDGVHGHAAVAPLQRGGIANCAREHRTLSLTSQEPRRYRHGAGRARPRACHGGVALPGGGW